MQIKMKLILQMKMHLILHMKIQVKMKSGLFYFLSWGALTYNLQK